MDTLQYTAHQLQAAIGIVAIGVALVVWLVTRWWWGKELRAVTSKYRDELEKANNRMTEKDEEIEFLNENLAGLRREYEKLMEANDCNITNLEAANEEVESLNATIAQNNEDLEATKSDIARYLGSLEEQKAKTLEYEKKYAGEKSGHDRLKKAYDKVLAEVSTMTNQLKEVNADLEKVQVETGKLKTDLARAKGQIPEYVLKKSHRNGIRISAYVQGEYIGTSAKKWNTRKEAEAHLKKLAEGKVNE